MGIAIAGLLLIGLNRRKLGAVAVTAAVFWLWVWSLPIISDMLSASLEGRYLQMSAEDLPPADALVLLGGGVRPGPPNWPYSDLNEGADRIWHAARLYHAGKAPVVIASGGSFAWQGERISEAEAMLGILLDLGVPSAAIMLEEQSRSTRENALYIAKLLQGQELEIILLVTSALHMPRALAAFRAVGIKAIPAPTDFEVMPQPNHPLRWLPDAGALGNSTRALKEYLGLLVYRLRGWA